MCVSVREGLAELLGSAWLQFYFLWVDINRYLSLISTSMFVSNYCVQSSSGSRDRARAILMKLVTWPEIPVTWPLHCGSTQAPPHISPSTGSCQALPLGPWRHWGNCRQVVPCRAVTWSLIGHVTPPPWWITTSVRLTTSDISDLQLRLESPARIFIFVAAKIYSWFEWQEVFQFAARIVLRVITSNDLSPMFSKHWWCET